MDPMLDPALFQALFGSTAMTPPVVPSPVVPPIDPTTLTPPMAPPQEAYRSMPMPPAAPMPTDATSLGAALEPQVPMPRPRPAEAPGGTYAAQAAGQAQGGGTDAILKSLRGVQMPAPPTPQKVSTPHAPQIRPIQGGQFIDLLASLGIGPQQALPGLKLPSTLGQALGGR